MVDSREWQWEWVSEERFSFGCMDFPWQRITHAVMYCLPGHSGAGASCISVFRGFLPYFNHWPQICQCIQADHKLVHFTFGLKTEYFPPYTNNVLRLTTAQIYIKFKSQLNGSQLAKMKKSIPDMSLP